MAGDENEVRHGAGHPAATPNVDASGERPVGPSEWTASDARGPLNAATLASAGKPVSPDEPALIERSAADPLSHVASETNATNTDASETNASETEVSARTAADGTPAGTVSESPVKRGSLWPVAAGIVIGAVIGAGSAYVADRILADPSTDRLAALSSRIDRLDQRPDPQDSITPLQTALAGLETKVTAANDAAQSADAKAETAQKTAQAPPVDGSALKDKLDALEATVGGLKQAGSAEDAKAVQAKLAETDTKVEALQKTTDDLAATSGRVAALDAGIATLQQQSASRADVKTLQDKLAPVEASTAALQKQATEAQTALSSLRSGQTSLEGRITSAPALAVVADSLISQIDRGLPFTAQVNALDALGVDPTKVALLRQWSDQGVPSSKVLADTFDPLVDGLLTAPVKAAGATSFVDRMKQGLSGLVAVRRVDDTGGDDLPSRVARIKADLAHDDVIAAVATWAALPGEVKVKPQAAAWGALAKTHADARATANAVESGAIAALGSKKS